MKDSQRVLQHYAASEQAFVKEVLAIQQDVLQNSRLKITNFLSLREQEILLSIIGNSANIIFYGGIEGCEKKIAFVSEYVIKNYKQNIMILAITYHKKFGVLAHRDVLGAILGLGIERGVIGDIVFDDACIYVAVRKNIAKYIIENLSKIGRQAVKVNEHQGMVIKEEEQLQYKTIYVSSLRIDSLIAHTIPCNREHAKALITKELVQINWATTRNINQIYRIGDIISVRKFGRIYIDNIVETKRSRFKIEVRIT